jgi:hypothetical protein
MSRDVVMKQLITPSLVISYNILQDPLTLNLVTTECWKPHHDAPCMYGEVQRVQTLGQGDLACAKLVHGNHESLQ